MAVIVNSGSIEHNKYAPMPFFNIARRKTTDDYVPYKTDTSNNSGETFYWRPRGKGADMHPDPHRYTKSVSIRPLMLSGMFGMKRQATTADNTIPFLMLGKKPQPVFVRSASYQKAGRKEGIAFHGRKAPETAKRAKYHRNDGPTPTAGSRGDNKQAKGSNSTVLTGSRGVLGKGTTASKTILGG